MGGSDERWSNMEVTLSEYEMGSLREYAGEVMLERADDRLLVLDGGEGDVEYEHGRLIASSEVYGALRSVETVFVEVGGERPPEAVKVAFTALAVQFLGELREALRQNLDQCRGSIEVTETTRDLTFLLFVLDGIFEGVTT